MLGVKDLATLHNLPIHYVTIWFEVQYLIATTGVRPIQFKPRSSYNLAKNQRLYVRSESQHRTSSWLRFLGGSYTRLGPWFQFQPRLKPGNLEQLLTQTTILRRFGIEHPPSVSTPMDPNIKWDLAEDLGEKMLDDIWDYQAFVGSLMYSAVSTLQCMLYTVAALLVTIRGHSPAIWPLLWLCFCISNVQPIFDYTSTGRELPLPLPLPSSSLWGLELELTSAIVW